MCKLSCCILKRLSRTYVYGISIGSCYAYEHNEETICREMSFARFLPPFTNNFIDTSNATVEILFVACVVSFGLRIVEREKRARCESDKVEDRSAGTFIAENRIVRSLKSKLRTTYLRLNLLRGFVV